MVNLFKPCANAKASCASFTLSGIVKVVKLSQLWNAKAPIVFTVSGMVTLVRLVQPVKA